MIGWVYEGGDGVGGERLIVTGLRNSSGVHERVGWRNGMMMAIMISRYSLQSFGLLAKTIIRYCFSYRLTSNLCCRNHKPIAHQDIAL